MTRNRSRSTEAPDRLSLRWRFFAAVVISLVALVFGGIYSVQQIQALERAAEDERMLFRKMHIFHQVDHAARMIIAPNPDAESLHAVSHDLAHERELLEVFSDPERDLIDLVMRGLSAPHQVAPVIRQRLGEFEHLHHEYDEAVIAGSARFSETLRDLRLSLFATVLVVAVFVVGPATVLMTSIVSGLDGVRRKVLASQAGRDPTLVPVNRSDEIGDIANAFDKMHLVVRIRQMQELLGRQLSAEREKMNQVISVAGGIAHEVRNPLAIMWAELEMLEYRLAEKGEGDLDKDTEHSIGAIRMAAERINALIARFSVLPSFDQTDADMLDINQLLGSIQEVVKLNEHLRRVDFDLDLAPGLPVVEASPARLGLGLYSLFHLATGCLEDEAGTISVQTEPRPDGVAVLLHTRHGGAGASCCNGTDSHGKSPCVCQSANDDEIEDFPELAACNSLIASVGGDLHVSVPTKGAIDITVTLRCHAPQVVEGAA